MHNIKSQNLYHAQYNLSKNPNYWKEIASQYQWMKIPEKTLQGNFSDSTITWFEDGVTNITVNCLDRHLSEHGNKTAIIFEPNNPADNPQKLTFQELATRVNQMCFMLAAKGVKKSDVVCLYMPMSCELLISTLACARIGAIHSVVFGGFSASSLASRIQDSQAKLIITSDESYRGDKTIGLKQIVDEALATCPSIQTVLVYKRTGAEISMKKNRDFYLHDIQVHHKKNYPAEPMRAEDPLFILYTSGSTGKPKGLLHTCGGYMIWTGETFKNVFQPKDDSLFWCTADIGWITGHSYIVYGPLLNATSQVIFEGIPTWPDASRFWEIIEKYKVTHFYTAPTAIRALESFGLDYVTGHDLDSLKVLGSVGEPINEEAWQWYHQHIGKSRCPIVDTWWQTETGGIMISALAGITPSIPSFATLPMPGVFPILVDEKGIEITSAVAEGNLCITEPWPGIARTIYDDHERYLQTYFSTYPGKYFTGDGARRDEHGNYRITGRVDDVLNVSGHRLGTAEIENSINEHESVVESAVVGYPHEIKGQGVFAYVILSGNLKTEDKKLLSELNTILSKNIGPIAKIDKLIVTSGLPKTRSGKIMRRILRKIAESEFNSLGDLSTLLNPEIVDEIKNKAMKN